MFVVGFYGGEMMLYLIWKLARGDFLYFIPIEGWAGVLVSMIARVVSKIIADFSGCLHFRHPYEMGGLAFSLSMMWSQVFPFVALTIYDEDGTNDPEDNGDALGEGIAFALICSFVIWSLLNVYFFCTIDLSYIGTFFGTKTAPQYTCELFLTGKDDFSKFRAVFKNRISYTKKVHVEVKKWVAENIKQWIEERPDWFKIERIPDEYLPKDVLEAEGGARRRRSSVSLREIIGLPVGEENEGRVHPQVGEEMKVEEL